MDDLLFFAYETPLNAHAIKRGLIYRVIGQKVCVTNPNKLENL